MRKRNLRQFDSISEVPIISHRGIASSKIASSKMETLKSRWKVPCETMGEARLFIIVPLIALKWMTKNFFRSLAVISGISLSFVPHLLQQSVADGFFVVVVD